jgi:hypothetical protein
MTSTETVGRWPVGASPGKFFFAIFSGFFRFVLCRVFIFAECFFALRPSARDKTLGKVLFANQNFAV